MVRRRDAGGETVTPAEVAADIVAKSGNTFHCRVVNFFKRDTSAFGAPIFHPRISPYYTDGFTNKPREIDIVTEIAWLYSRVGDATEDTLYILQLFIECKYIKDTTVFWFGDRDDESAVSRVRHHSSIKVNKGGHHNKHHYLASGPLVAKLFESDSNKSADNQSMSMALNQCLNAMVDLRERLVSSENLAGIKKRHRISNGSTLGPIGMPVIMCHSFDKFFRVDMSDPMQEPKAIREAFFMLEVHYSFLSREGKNKDEYFLIDVVNFEKIDDYLAVLDADRAAMTFGFSS